MKYIVYQTTNTVNKKIYIGVHKTIDPELFDGYIGCGVNIHNSSSYMKPHTPFQCAVKKYGGKVFLRTILYIYDTVEEASKKEAALVDKDFILNPNTYNVALGGLGYPKLLYSVNQFDLNGKLIKKWEDTNEAIEFYNISPFAISTALQFKESLLGFFWSREASIDVNKYSHGSPSKPVYQYLESGKCINIYKSIYEAAKLLNIDITTLSTNIRLQSLVDNKWYFSDKLYDEFKPKPKISLRGKLIYLYKDTGEYINSFTNKDLMDYLGTKSWNTIYRSIHAQEGIYKNYQLLLEFKGDTIPEKFKNSKNKEVLVFDKNGTFIKECKSVQKAAKEFNARLSGVNRVLRGLQHTTNNYVFKFKKEV